MRVLETKCGFEPKPNAGFYRLMRVLTKTQMCHYEPEYGFKQSYLLSQVSGVRQEVSKWTFLYFAHVSSFGDS